MAKYIDREKLKTDFDDKAYYISHGQNNVERGMTLNGINQIIDEQQPADVAPIIHAKWEHNYERYGAPIECTNCKQEAHVDKRCMFIRSLYCPHCGAKMDKE